MNSYEYSAQFIYAPCWKANGNLTYAVDTNVTAQGSALVWPSGITVRGYLLCHTIALFPLHPTFVEEAQVHLPRQCRWRDDLSAASSAFVIHWGFTSALRESDLWGLMIKSETEAILKYVFILQFWVRHACQDHTYTHTPMTLESNVLECAASVCVCWGRTLLLLSYSFTIVVLNPSPFLLFSFQCMYFLLYKSKLNLHMDFELGTPL